MTEVCPYCGFPAEDVQAEVAHMNAAHRDVIAERLREGGFRREADGTITDLRADPDA